MSKTSTFGHSVLQGDSRFVLTHDDRPWTVVLAGLLWLVAGLTAGYWGLQAMGRSAWVPVASGPASLPAADPQAVARSLGHSAPMAAPADTVSAAPVALRYTLLGVVADRRQRGAALIAIGGEPPRPYAVGATLEGGLVLQSVDERVARLGPSMDGPSTVELPMPQQPDAPAAARAGGQAAAGRMLTPPAAPVYTPPPMPVYTPPAAPATGAIPDPTPAMPPDRGGDGGTVVPGS
ncbi:MAG: hypothetical protein EP306_14075 [Burkholderiales bacterium]|nr:MAG: hypothetical protein EP306_14075 [Burkholderiales bacterium]